MVLRVAAAAAVAKSHVKIAIGAEEDLPAVVIAVRLGHGKDNLLAMRIHGVTAEWLNRMEEVGMRPPTIDRAVAFRIHGVDPEFVTELRELGYDDLDGDDLLRIRIHGLDRILRSRGGGG